MKKIIWILCLCLMCVLTIVGCDNGENTDEAEDNKGYAIYYLNENGTGLKRDYVEIYENDEKLLVGRLIEAMMNPEESELKSAINENVKILDYSIVDKVAYINFSAAYDMQDKVSELLCRASFVLTLTQLDYVEYVGMNVNGQQLVVGETAVSLMSAGTFADVSSGSELKDRRIDVKLYFANEEGDMLVPYTTSILYDNNKSLERAIVDELILGPSKEGYNRTLKSDIKVIEVFNANRVCYVFVDKSINDTIGVSEELMVYSIVNSLTELDHIDKVQIVIEGDTSTKLNDTYSIAEPFLPNYDLVEREEE